MRLGTVVDVPNEYSRFGTIKDSYGVRYTIAQGQMPDKIEKGDQVAYKVEIWANDSGLAYGVKKA